MSMGMEWEWEERRGEERRQSLRFLICSVSRHNLLSGVVGRSVRWAASPLSLSPTDLLVPKANAQGVRDVQVDQRNIPLFCVNIADHARNLAKAA